VAQRFSAAFAGLKAYATIEPGLRSWERTLETNILPQHIGIVGCSAEGAALCYKTICVEGARLLGPHAHPEVSMHTHSLADYMTRIYRNDWQAVGDLMLASANKLAAVGADFLICPDNTIHQAFRFVAPRSPRPWLHIAEVVADQAVERGFRRIGLTGTRWLVESDVYPDVFSARTLAYVRNPCGSSPYVPCFSTAIPKMFPFVASMLSVNPFPPKVFAREKSVCLRASLSCSANKRHVPDAESFRAPVSSTPSAR